MIASLAARTTRASARAWCLGACGELPVCGQHMSEQASERNLWWHLLSACGGCAFCEGDAAVQWLRSSGQRSSGGGMALGRWRTRRHLHVPSRPGTSAYAPKQTFEMLKKGASAIDMSADTTKFAHAYIQTSVNFSTSILHFLNACGL